MLEQQRARQPGETMALCGRTYKVEEVVDSDGMYMNYRVSFPQLKPQWESVVYELYPKGMGEHIRRGADGALFCDDVGKMEMQAYVLPFWKGFQAQADALAGMLSSREGGIGYVSTHGGHYILRVSPRGTPLSRRLSGSPLSFEALMGIAAGLLDGLEHYHQRGLLHLDICPQTVRLLEGCGVLLEHRGYGLWLSQMPGAFPLAGTPGYAPPEVQLRNYSQIDQTSDLYAVCAVLFRLLDGALPVRRLCVMLQKEAVDRVAAAPGSKEYGPLAVFTAYRAEMERLFRLPPDCFVPQPHVESEVIALDLRPPQPEERELLRLVKDCFRMRRKTLVNNLQQRGLTREEALHAVEKAGLTKLTRAETLGLSDFLRLLEILSQ